MKKGLEFFMWNFSNYVAGMTTEHKPTKVLTGLVFVLLFFILLPTNNVWGITISPLTFDINVNPGETVTNYITLTNTDSFPLSLTISAQDFTAIGEQGGVLIDEGIPPEISAKSWMIFDANSFVLSPAESRKVQFTLNVPLEAEPGGKYISVIASTGLTVNEGTAVGTTQKIGSLLLIRVAGDVVEKLSVKSFGTPEFLEYGPIPFSLRFENTGTVHVRPAGLLIIKNVRGKKVAEISLPQKRVLPQTIRLIDESQGLVWDVKWGFGKYTADITAVYGSANESLSVSTSFWIIPWKVLASGLFILTALIVFLIKARHRLSLALKILVFGEKKTKGSE